MGEQGRIRLLNANKGVTNTDHGKSFYKEIIDVTDYIYNSLADHCGKYALNSLIIEEYGLGANNNNVFTTDGITILSFMELLSPLQEYIKDQMSYIGSRVDNAAGDGTTTSMMLAAKFTNYFFKHILSKKMNIKERYDYLNNIKCKLDLIRNDLENYKLTVDKLAKYSGQNKSETKGNIAFIQSMLVSKGNVGLSSCMREIYSILPDEMNSSFYKEVNEHETDYKFKTKYPEYEVTCKVILTSLDVLNRKLGTEYVAEGADLIVSSVTMSQGLNEYDILDTHLSKRTKPTVVLYHEISPEIIQKWNSLSTKELPIVLIKYVDGDVYGKTEPILLRAAATAAGKNTIDRVEKIEEAIIPNVNIRIRGGYVFIGNLYEVDETTKLNVRYDENDNESEYMQLVQEIRDVIHGLKNEYMLPNENAHAEHVAALRAMVSAKTPILSVGGKTVDVHESLSIVKDVLGSVTSTMEEGFIVDGNALLYHLSTKHDLKIFSDAMFDVIKVILRIPKRQVKQIRKKYDKEYQPGRYANIDYFDTGGELFEDFSYHESIIHPYRLYKELLDRIEEVLMKLMATERVIVPGTANTHKKG